MVKRLNDLVVKVGEYTNKNGEKKADYRNIGAELQGDDGSTYLLIDRWFNPAGVPNLNGKADSSIAVWKFPPREKMANPNAPGAVASPASAPNDDNPF
jgi:hypothetical protein